jgi:outer membrane protein
LEWIRTPQDEQQQDLGDFRPVPLGTPVAIPIRRGQRIMRTIVGFTLSVWLGIAAVPTPLLAQALPILSLDEAVAQALEHNRLVKDAVLDAEKSVFRVDVARSRRLPQFQISVLAGQLLRPIDFTFPAGSFGTYADGPVPSTDAKITTPSQLTTFVTGSVDLPLLQQHEIGLGIRATELAGEIAREGVRHQRQKIAADVRTAYFTLVATQAAVDAARDTVRTLEEAQRVTTQYRIQEAVLRAEALEVDARLARSRYELSAAENGLATQREQLNQLLGRELTTEFRVHAIQEDTAGGMTLDAARQRATESRPEIRQADLKSQQADYERRLAKAEYLPDLSLSARYLGFNNFQMIPPNVASAGVYLSWEPFDWGRRRNNVAEKAKTVAQARNGAEETRAQVAVEVGAKYRKWEESVLLLKAARTGHDAALEQFRVTTNRYKEQAVLVRDLLQAQSRSADAAFQYQQALASYWSALADLRRAIGDE